MNDDSTHRVATETGFLAGGGELGRLIRAFDWRATALGAPETWPQNLRMALRIMLTSRQPIWIGWGKELIYFYNDPYKSIIGGKHPWALGRPTGEVWREIWPDIEGMLETAMRGDQGTYVESQLLIMHRNGYAEETYYTFSYSPIPNDDGTVGGIICANSDDTQRVMGERQLALLRDLAENSAHARNWQEAIDRAAQTLCRNARDLPFAMIYAAAPDGSGMTLAGASGIEPGHPLAPQGIGMADESSWPLAEVLRTQEGKIVSELPAASGVEIPRGPWHEAPRQAALLPILASGEAGAAGVLVVGLNPFRLPEDNYLSFLKLVASQIAAAVSNAQAYEAQRRRAEALAELDRAKTTFFSNVSHEFRTPLTLMLGPLEDALADTSAPLPRVHLGRLETAHHNSLRLLKLVNSLLDFSRIEAGRVEARYEPVNLSSLTAELASNFRSATDRAGLALRIDCPPLPQPVYVDRHMWERIVLNLLSNAFKFTFEGKIAVAVRASGNGRDAELEIRDTGVGIPEHELPRLFERFHRVEGQKSRSFEGSGIGLALVQELVKLHGGSVSVKSAVGSGTSFIVSVPFGTAHLAPGSIDTEPSQAAEPLRAEAYIEEALRWLPESEPRAEEAPADRAEDAGVLGLGIRTAGATVLVVDDNADMRGYMRRLLGTRWRVETAANGRAALEAIRRRKPDLVLTDVMMPEIDGIELLRRLRGDASLRDLPVILVSARAGEDARVEGLDAGAEDYLTKPFTARELIARVNANLEMARIRREATRELERANEMLEARVQSAIAERAAAEAQLREAQKMEAIGKLTGGVAHDFNNVLQVIAGNLKLLTHDLAGNLRGERRLETAIAALARGSKLAAQLLAFGRRQPLAPKVINLGRLVRGVDDMLRRALGEGIQIETIVAGGLWNTFVDAIQVENALLNLAINSRDAMNGHGKLTIEAGNASLDDAYAERHGDVAAGQYVMLAVTDMGGGIPPEIIERVFEPFFTTKPEGQGTGLGLSMVYGFVKQSGGHIKIYSEPGHGTTVRIYLPRARAQEDVETDVQLGPATGGTETVLVVEDDEDVRATVVDLLSDLGYRVLKAKDAQSALAIIESGVPIDVLFTDVVMPGPLRSPELARKARERLPDVAVLFTSGYTENAIVHGGRLDEGIDLLSKPYSQEALARKLRHVLRNQQQRKPGQLGRSSAEAGTVDGAARAPRLKVLLVDDDPDIRLTTSMLLTDLGHTVESAGTGDRALEILDGNSFDVLVTDLVLPGIRGDELATRALARHPGLGIVFASGYESAQRSVTSGPLAQAVFLLKPYDDQALERALQEAGRRASGWSVGRPGSKVLSSSYAAEASHPGSRGPDPPRTDTGR